VRAREDAAVVDLLRGRRIPLEMCIVSNVRTGVVGSVAEHPAGTYFKEGLFVTVNSDDPVMFNTTLTDEYLALVGELGFSPGEVREVALNTVKASFLPQDERDGLLREFEAGLTALEP
jgi:adenosine deaminase